MAYVRNTEKVKTMAFKKMEQIHGDNGTNSWGQWNCIHADNGTNSWGQWNCIHGDNGTNSWGQWNKFMGAMEQIQAS